MSAIAALMITTQTPPTTPPLKAAAVEEFTVAPADAFSGKMSVVFESRDYLNSGSYPPIDDHPTPDADRFSDPDPVTGLAEAFAAPNQYVDGSVDLGGPPLSKENSPIVTTPSRMKAIPKPDREVTKNMDGKYVCSWVGCTEDIREFGRKCEWK